MSYQPFATGRKRVTSLSSTPQTLFTVGEPGKSITAFHFNGGAAARVVTIRLIGGAVVFRTQVPANTTLYIPFACVSTSAGVEALTDSATADVEVVVPFFD